MIAEPAVPHPASGRELKAVVDAERTGQPFLLFRDGQGDQRLMMLSDPSSPLTVGRGAQCDLTLDWDDQISTVHAELQCAGGEWTIIDDGLSTNGTFVNRMRLSGRQRLRDGDHVRLGRTVLVYRLCSPAPVVGTVTAPDAPAVDRLSDMQQRVLVALCRPYGAGDGYVTPATNRQIADEVFLSIDAVKTHLRLLFRKFDIDDLPQNQKRVRLAECAMQWGLVSRRDLVG